MEKKKRSKIDSGAGEEHTAFDIEFEDADAALSDKLQALRNKLKACEKEKSENLLGWQRSRADAINREKEFAAEKAAAAERAVQHILADLFPVLDSFDMAFGNAAAWERVDKEWRVGIEHVYAQMMRALEQHGISTVGEDGAPYDPEIHEAIKSEEVEKKEMDGKIVRVAQKGYRMKGRILRPAKVIIGTYNK